MKNDEINIRVNKSSPVYTCSALNYVKYYIVFKGLIRLKHTYILDCKQDNDDRLKYGGLISPTRD